MSENEVKELLKQYSMCKKFIDAQASVNKYFNLDCTQKIDEKELYEARIQSIESLMELLKPSDEYTLLYLHYVKGIAVEKCAEYMYVSRSTVFRILKKAHRRLCKIINKKEQTADVVEVVRCKDCKYASKCTDGYYACKVDHRLAHDETDYCSYGERKEQ